TSARRRPGAVPRHPRAGSGGNRHPTREGEKRMEHSRRQFGRFAAFWFLLPCLAGLILFSIIPVFYAFWISFTDWDGLKPIDPRAGVPGFVGLDNSAAILAG